MIFSAGSDTHSLVLLLVVIGMGGVVDAVVYDGRHRREAIYQIQGMADDFRRSIVKRIPSRPNSTPARGDIGLKANSACTPSNCLIIANVSPHPSRGAQSSMSYKGQAVAHQRRIVRCATESGKASNAALACSSSLFATAGRSGRWRMIMVVVDQFNLAALRHANHTNSR